MRRRFGASGRKPGPLGGGTAVRVLLFASSFPPVRPASGRVFPGLLPTVHGQVQQPVAGGIPRHLLLERGVQSNWAKKPGVNPNILWLTRPFRESFRIFPGKSMCTGASRGSRTPWHPACSRRETSRIVQIHEPMPPQRPHRGREPHPPCPSQDSAGETCRNLRDVPMPPPHFQTMCWPQQAWIPVLVSPAESWD